MDKQNENYEAMKQKLEEKTGDSGLFSSVLGLDSIPKESLGALGSNSTLEEFLSEMKRQGMEVIVAPKHRRDEPASPINENPEEIPIAPAVEDTPENRKHYSELKEMAREKLGETGFIEAVLETETADANAPVDETALEKLNTASYQGEFGALGELAKELKAKNE